MRKTRVLLVTSPNDHCGIREYGRMLIDAVSRHQIEVLEWPNPDPTSLVAPPAPIIHVNHHAALHSQWKPEHVRRLQQQGYKVVVTQHDTFEDFSIMMDRGMSDFRNANALIVHEPVAGLVGEYVHVHYFRQGVPGPEPPGVKFGGLTVGTCGFNFPWKRFDLLAECAEEAGWIMRAPMDVRGRGWMSRNKLISYLTACDATAFLHDAANSGTSGVIRLGIAARKPVIATPCRQFRDLHEDKGLGWEAIWWVNDRDEIVNALKHLARSDTQSWIDVVTQLAECDSWKNLGEKYAGVYRRLVT